MDEYKCEECNKTFPSEDSMNQHVGAKHANMPLQQKKRKISKFHISLGILIIILIAAVVTTLNTEPANSLVPQDHVRGAADATVTITEFSDFQCPFCGSVAPTVKQVLDEYNESVNLIYKHFPLARIHENAQKAAEAAECAGAQDKFYEMHDIMFERQDRLNIAALKSYAAELELDTQSFNRCLDSGAARNIVRNNIQEGESKSVRSTPTFFVNNRRLSGSQDITAFRTAIEAELNA